MVTKEGAACLMPGKSKVAPATWPMPEKETLRTLESFGYDYLYVGQGKYRVWVKRAHTHEYMDAAGIDKLIDKSRKKIERAERKLAKQKEESQKKSNATKGKATSKRRRRSSRLRRDKSKGKS